MALNTLYLKTPSKLWLDIARKAEKKYGWTPKLWVGKKSSAGLILDPPHSRAQYYTQEDAILGIAPKFKEKHKWIAIDSNLLNQISWHQPIVQEMINRWFINPDIACSKSRNAYYYQLIENWLNIFIHHKINLVICPTIPHRIHDYIAYIIAEHLEIPYIMVDGTAAIRTDEDDNIDCWYYPIHNIFNRTQSLYENFTKQKPSINISEQTINYAKRLSGNYEKATPKYLNEKNQKSLLYNGQKSWKMYIPRYLKVLLQTLRHFLKGKPLNQHGHYEIQSFFSKSHNFIKIPNIYDVYKYTQKIHKQTSDAFKWYNSHSASPEFSETKPYVVFMASKQPERSTCPDAGHFQCQYDIIGTLREIIPASWDIYYKEHPSNFRKPWTKEFHRSISYYKNLQRISPSIVFLPLQTDPFSLIDGAETVATATGSGAWESIMRGKPALIFGSNWFEHCSGVYRIKSLADGHKAIEHIISGQKPDHNDLLKYVEFFNIHCKDISWRRDLYLGAKSYEDPLYAERVSIYTSILKEGYDNSQSSEKLKSIQRYA